MTPVLFRTDRNGNDVTAVFPTLPAGRGEMTCYQHIGQHSGCTMEWLRTTRPATEFDYSDLLDELRYSVGYDDLKIVKRISSEMRAERRAAE